MQLNISSFKEVQGEKSPSVFRLHGDVLEMEMSMEKSYDPYIAGLLQTNTEIRLGSKLFQNNFLSTNESDSFIITSKTYSWGPNV